MRIYIIVLSFLFCINWLLAQPESNPLIKGVTEQFQSEVLNEMRTINIYLPENYNQNDTVKYPVIYIPDGGIEEDFIPVAEIVCYNTNPWVNRFPKSIVAGVANTNRKRDFTSAVSNFDF